MNNNQRFMVFPFKITNKNTDHNTNTNEAFDEPRKKRKKKDRERGDPVETHGESEAARLG